MLAGLGVSCLAPIRPPAWPEADGGPAMSEVTIMDADDLRRLELLVNALGRHRSESIQYSLAEVLEDYHWDAAEQAGLPSPLHAGDSLVAQELAHALAVLGALSGPATCRAPGCSEQAPAHFGLCPQHDLEEALKLDGAE